MSSEDYKALTLRLYAAIGEVFRTGDLGLLDLRGGLCLMPQYTHWPTHGTSTHGEIGARHGYGYHALS
jgi:hypothetical protein